MSTPHTHRLEFFFDFSSPWTYMAFSQIEALCRDTGATLEWKPFYVAAVFREINHHVGEMRARAVPAKLDYYWTDMRRWADRLGIRIGRPPVYGGGSRPLNSAVALRGAFLALDQGRIAPYAHAVFRSYWDELQDVADRAVLQRLAASVGMDTADFAARLDAPETRQRLECNTREFMARGGFGTPSFFVDGTQLYFGNDRVDFVREALKGRADVPQLAA